MIRTRLPDPRPPVRRLAGDVIVPSFGEAITLAHVRAAVRGSRQRVFRHRIGSRQLCAHYVVADVR